MSETNEFIYLLCEREFTKTGENIYKIGKSTRQELARFSDYSKGSLLLFYCICSNASIAETNIIGVFKVKYIQRRDIGIEYFEGNYITMIEDIIENIRKIGFGNDIHKKNVAYLEFLKQKNMKSNKALGSNTELIRKEIDKANLEILEIMETKYFIDKIDNFVYENINNEVGTLVGIYDSEKNTINKDIPTCKKTNNDEENKIEDIKNLPKDNSNIENIKIEELIKINEILNINQNNQLDEKQNELTNGNTNDTKNENNIVVKDKQMQDLAVIKTSNNISAFQYDFIDVLQNKLNTVLKDVIKKTDIVEKNKIKELKLNNMYVINWFINTYIEVHKDTKDVPYLQLKEIYKTFCKSDNYKSLNPSQRQKFGKFKFFNIIKADMFFTNYYVENRSSLRYFIKGWVLKNTTITTKPANIQDALPTIEISSDTNLQNTNTTNSDTTLNTNNDATQATI
jgi:hypothetical protein